MISVTISSISKAPNHQAYQTIGDGRSGAWIKLSFGILSIDGATVISQVINLVRRGLINDEGSEHELTRLQ